MTSNHTMFEPHVPEEDSSSMTSSGQRATDSDLFSAFLAGEDQAFMELFDRHTHRLYLYCLKLVNDPRAADDLIQDLWERVIKLRRRTGAPPDNPLGYLLRIVRNLSLNYLRDRRHHGSIDDLSDFDHPTIVPHELTHHEELVVMALPQLPISYREVLILNAYSGYGFDEIAEMLGEPVGAIRTRAWRARAQLGRIIAGYIEIDNNRDPETNDFSDRH